MTKRTAALTSVLLLVLGIAAFTGSALAGNGNANGKADTQADVHGNSANAAGQVKQDSVSTQATGGGSGDQAYGPGNSQPHKVVDCKRNHWVDVHAVKSYATAPCSTLTGTTNGTITASVAGSTNGPSVTTATSSNASPPTRGHGTAGGVLGVTASGGTGPAGGVLGAIASVGSGVLPFTGISLWLVVLAAAGLIVFGLLLRRGGRALV